MKNASFFITAALLFPKLLFSSPDSTAHPFKLIPESHFGAEFRTYSLQKNSYFKQRYLSELALHIDFALFSIYDRLYQKWEYSQFTGFGRQDEAVFMDPRDASFHATAYLEYRLKHLLIQSGIEHPCFHEIDRHEKPVLYWNKFFIGAQSPQPLKFAHSRKTSFESYSDRFSWLARWGYFPRSFGNVDPSIIRSKHLPYIHEFSFKCSFDAYAWKNMVAVLYGETVIGGEENGVYWSQLTGGAVELRGKSVTGALFINYIRDDLYSTLSKDRLLEIGVQVKK